METLLINNEKSYYTKEERILYLKIVIDEFMKHGNIQMANYYQTMLNVLESMEKSTNEAHPNTK